MHATCIVTYYILPTHMDFDMTLHGHAAKGAHCAHFTLVGFVQCSNACVQVVLPTSCFCICNFCKLVHGARVKVLGAAFDTQSKKLHAQGISLLEVDTPTTQHNRPHAAHSLATHIALAQAPAAHSRGALPPAAPGPPPAPGPPGPPGQPAPPAPPAPPASASHRKRRSL